jgi:hypothetical protein
MWNILTVCVAYNTWYKMYKWIWIHYCRGKSYIQKEDFSATNWTWIKEETSQLLHFEDRFVWCWNFDTTESRSEINWMFLNVVPETDGEDLLDRTCEKSNKWYIDARGGKECLTYSNNKGKWNGHILCLNCLLKHVTEGKVEGRI